MKLLGLLRTRQPKIEFLTLKDVPLEDIHRAFTDAFSDYSIKMDMPQSKFLEMLDSNNFIPELSAGAFRGGWLTGIILNGTRTDRDGMVTAYDCGTGVLPQYRNRGVSTGMYDRVFDLLGAAGIHEYLLEVLKNNSPAVHVYLKLGFHITREFICYRAGRSSLSFIGRHCVEFCPPSSFSADEFSSFHDFAPAWQNSGDRILRSMHNCCAFVRKEGKIAGYGVINRKSGAVYRLAVSPEYRREGIASSLMDALLRQTQAPQISFLNLDTRCGSLPAFLLQAGFSGIAEQYEMKKLL